MLVSIEKNKTNEHLSDLIRVGSTVIVVDGSYMLNEHEKRVCGLDFQENGMYKLMRIVDINKPFPTNISTNEDILCYQNNCKIQDTEGNIYYCSRINIKRFEIFSKL